MYRAIELSRRVSTLLEMAKNKQSNLIANVKMLNIGVINKYTINLEIGKGLSSIS